ncbi:hypothetical protein D9615_007852 [Tricholomella constricta]|uniref:Uncharacterized protein n=1 Tax=Tricholomella constricta TaxID=117010 RepID=A0A8H5H4N1_9AGAR|nr:hypothetical protein D9615_007852 [Tricholomella constricta]
MDFMSTFPEPASRLSLTPDYDSQLVLGPTRLVSNVHTGASITALPPTTTQRATPQYVQSLTMSRIKYTSTPSQPPQANSSRLSIASALHYGSSSSTPTTVVSVTSVSVLSWSSLSSISATSAALLSTSSVVPFLASSIASSPASIATAVSTVTASSPSLTSEATTESATPTSSFLAASASPSSSSIPSEDISSNNASHHAPFYVAIVVGTIVVIGLIAAIIAWVFRLRLHAKRRRAIANVPWANHQNDDGLEEGRDATFIGQPIDRIGSKDISSQDVIPWEPRGDRDVGEPKRSKSTLRGSVHSSSYVPDPFADTRSYPVFAEGVAYPLPLYQHYTNSYLDADGSLDGHQSMSTLGPLQVANVTPGDASVASSRASTALGMNTPVPGDGEYECGTPRENQTGSRPRFLGLEGDGLRVPWSSTRRSSFASRRLGGSGNWERLPMPGETQNADRVGPAAADDGWTASLKSNLTHAFNAVASTLPSGPSLMRSHVEDDDDILTPRPRQGVVSRRSIRSNFSGVDFNEKSLSRKDTGSSRPWSLEERDDGTGRVHFHGRGLNGYGYGTPQLLGSFATLNAPSSAGTSIHRMSTHGSNAPLITRPPQSAFLKPEAYRRDSQHGKGNQRQPSMRNSLSGASSVYSMASGMSGALAQPPPAPRLPSFSRHSTIRVDALHTVSEKKEEDGDGATEQRPASLVTRSSSSGCSVTSYYYGADATSVISDATEMEEVAHKALTDRRRKLRRAV